MNVTLGDVRFDLLSMIYSLTFYSFLSDQFKLVDPRLARKFAKEHSKEYLREPDNGVLAFGGEFVGSNTTLV